MCRKMAVLHTEGGAPTEPTGAIVAIGREIAAIGRELAATGGACSNWWRNSKN